jgi:hypothetical protein
MMRTLHNDSNNGQSIRTGRYYVEEFIAIFYTTTVVLTVTRLGFDIIKLRKASRCRGIRHMDE